MSLESSDLDNRKKPKRSDLASKEMQAFHKTELRNELAKSKISVEYGFTVPANWRQSTVAPGRRRERPTKTSGPSLSTNLEGDEAITFGRRSRSVGQACMLTRISSESFKRSLVVCHGASNACP